MTPPGRAWPRRCAAVAAVLAVSACSTSVNGTAVRAAGGPAPGAVDVSLLDPGNYPTKAQPPLGVAGSAGAGALLEAQRLADFVIAPWEVDPALTAPLRFGFSPGSMPMLPRSFGAVMDPEVKQAAVSHGAVAGFATARKVDGQKDLLNVVIRMPDAASASAAAMDMGAARLAAAAAANPPVAATSAVIPDHPEAVASTYTFSTYDTKQLWFVVDSFTAHGSYVLQQRAELIDSAEAATQLVGNALDMQQPRIDAFVPTDPAQLTNLPRDPSGLLAKTLPVGANKATVNDDMTLGHQGGLLYEADPVVAAKQYADSGVDVVVHADAWVYQARDHAGAVALAPAVAASTDASKPVAAAPNLPGSACQQYSDGGMIACTAIAGRYLLQVSSRQLKDAHQKAAAQYMLLAASS